MMNAYFGTWRGNEEDLVPRLQQIGRDYPTKMLIVSEFGYPEIFSPDPVTADKVRIRTIENQLEKYQKFDFVAGAIFWCYQDYKSHQNLWLGHQEGYVDHGVVDEYRQRRPSFWTWGKKNQPVIFSNAKWLCDGKGDRVGFEVGLSERSLNEIPSYPLRDNLITWELRDRDGNLLASGGQAVHDLQQAVLVQGNWAAGTSLPLHLRITFLDAKGNSEAATALDAYPLHFSGQRAEDMTQTPH